MRFYDVNLSVFGVRGQRLRVESSLGVELRRIIHGLNHIVIAIICWWQDWSSIPSSSAMQCLSLPPYDGTHYLPVPLPHHHHLFVFLFSFSIFFILSTSSLDPLKTLIKPNELSTQIFRKAPRRSKLCKLREGPTLRLAQALSESRA